MSSPPLSEFVEDITERGFKYYIFDWDDNILHMPTQIILEKKDAQGHWHPHTVSTSQFAQIRGDSENYRPPGGADQWGNVFQNFLDAEEHDHAESTFLADTRQALKSIVDGTHTGAPSFHVFKKTLIEGRLFGIVTARGHRSESIRTAVEYVIENTLTPPQRVEMLTNLRSYLKAFSKDHSRHTDDEVLDCYLSLNRYHGVTSPSFNKTILKDAFSPSQNPEKAKQLAIRDIVQHFIHLANKTSLDRRISVGFSDDDKANVTAAISYIDNHLAKEFPNVTFVVYDTSDPQIKGGKKITIRGQLEFPI